MMKMKIEGLSIAYKNVSDLNTKVHHWLTKIQKQREKREAELIELKKKEKSLIKFLGHNEEVKTGPSTEQK